MIWAWGELWGGSPCSRLCHQDRCAELRQTLAPHKEFLGSWRLACICSHLRQKESKLEEGCRGLRAVRRCRKTLQGISLLWTLLQNGHEQLGGSPMAKRIIICCPTSLVSNWDSECTKWLKACCPYPSLPSQSLTPGSCCGMLSGQSWEACIQMTGAVLCRGVSGRWR